MTIFQLVIVPFLKEYLVFGYKKILSDYVYMDLGVLVMIGLLKFHIFVLMHVNISARFQTCMHHGPISDTRISPYPSFEKTDFATRSTQCGISTCAGATSAM